MMMYMASAVSPLVRVRGRGRVRVRIRVRVRVGVRVRVRVRVALTLALTTHVCFAAAASGARRGLLAFAREHSSGLYSSPSAATRQTYGSQLGFLMWCSRMETLLGA